MNPLYFALILLLSACSSTGDPPAPAPVTQQQAQAPAQPEPQSTPATPPAPTPAPAPAPAAPPTPAPEPAPKPEPKPEITLHFEGFIYDDSPVSGTITYELFQGPAATDIRGLKPNVLYALKSWDATVTAGPKLLTQVEVPSNSYRDTGEGNMVEFCQGNCVFASGPTVTLNGGMS